MLFLFLSFTLFPNLREAKFSQLLQAIEEGKTKENATIYDLELVALLQKGHTSAFSHSNFITKLVAEHLFESAKYVLTLIWSDPEEVEKLQLEIAGPEGDKMSLLFNLLHEEIVLKIMSLHPRQWKMKSRNGLKENLLHYFIKLKFIEAIKELLAKEGVEELLLQEDAAGNYPIMTVLSQGMEDTAQQLWKLMIKSSGKESSLQRDNETNTETGDVDNDCMDIETFLTHKNKRRNSLLHICAENSQNCLMEEIFQSEEVCKELMIKALTEKNPDGKTVLALLNDQDTMLNILSKLTLSHDHIAQLDNKGRNIFHTLVFRDFVRVIMLLKSCIPREKFLEMLLQQGSRHNNNVLMRAALRSATESLQFLLVWCISNEQLSSEELNRILHDRDDFGNNLLSLVLQQGEALKFSKQILLELEKRYHFKEKDRPWKSFIECMKRNIDPSISVLEAINDVETTLPKSPLKTSLFKGKAFVQHFLLPSTVIAVDIGFDILLIKEYYSTDQRCLDEQYRMCLDFLQGGNSTSSVEGCSFPYSHPVPAYACIPLKLTNQPRQYI